MCGITGFVAFSGIHDDLVRAISAMTAALSHRGPDDSGTWLDRASGVALGHTRLSILDLSPLGRQPMQSACGRWVTAFNGEIYNHLDLRKELESRGVRFRGNSDTEVLTAAISEWGPAAAAVRCNGMFAVAAWDRLNRILYLLRDRIGEKPLYYGTSGQDFVFGSELKSLHRYSGFEGRIDPTAVYHYLSRGYVPAPLSIFQGIRKLPPGCLVRFRAQSRIVEDPEPYWSLDRGIQNGQSNPFRGSLREAADELEKLLADSIRIRMQSDVPLGAMLSGGVDSSTVVALMQAHSTSPVKTFTIGFQSEAWNEADHAAAVARRLGTDHVEMQIGSRELIHLIPRLSNVYDEPFADSSQIPMLMVSELARRQVTVALSGDGGDEVFGGYDRYRWMRTLWKWRAQLPLPVRAMTTLALRFASQSNALSSRMTPQRALARKFGIRNLPDKAQRLAAILSAENEEAAYHLMTSTWLKPERLISNDVDPLPHSLPGPAGLSLSERMMRSDTLTYLPDDILVKVDRASMSVALEMRVPLLDHRIVEFGWTLPAELRAGASTQKAVLRSVLYRYLPEAMMNRPKMGFAVPLGEWLRSDLRQWAEDLLSSSGIGADGLLNPVDIRRSWRDHISGNRDCSHEIWSVLALLNWQNAFRDSKMQARSLPIDAAAIAGTN